MAIRTPNRPEAIRLRRHRLGCDPPVIGPRFRVGRLRLAALGGGDPRSADTAPSDGVNPLITGESNGRSCGTAERLRKGK
jgi:hypothetical protein